MIGGIGACIAGLTIAEFARPHQAVPRLAAPPTIAVPAGWTQLAPNVAGQPVAVEAADARLLSGQLAIDSGPGGAQTIWSFSTPGGRLTATPLAITGRNGIAGPPVSLGRIPPHPPAPITYAVARWGPPGREAVFELTNSRNAVGVRAISLTDRKVLLTTRVPAAAVAPGARRDVTVVSAGRRPELVVDVRGASRVMRVTTYSGATGFRRATLNVASRLQGSFSPSSWKVSAGQVQTGAADLLLLGSDSRAPSAEIEAHVLLASSGYRRFGAQTALGLPLASLKRLRFLVGHDPRGPMIYAVNPGGGTIEKLLFR
jgi:hypothetical protein